MRTSLNCSEHEIKASGFMGRYGVWIGMQDPVFWRSLWPLSSG